MRHGAEGLRLCDSTIRPAEPEADVQKQQNQQQQRRQQASVEAERARERASQEQASQRAWILQYMEHQDSSDDGSSGKVTCPDGAIHCGHLSANKIKPFAPEPAG